MRRQLSGGPAGRGSPDGGEPQARGGAPRARYVADEADVLSKRDRAVHHRQNQSLFENTGGEIVVVSVDFMDGMDAADYAMAVAESWGGIGDESLNNGFLLVYAVGENKVWAMAGSGIESGLCVCIWSVCMCQRNGYVVLHFPDKIKCPFQTHFRRNADKFDQPFCGILKFIKKSGITWNDIPFVLRVLSLRC